MFCREPTNSAQRIPLPSQAQLSRVLFPLGPLTKSMVRQLAATAGLATQGRKDSQGICFLGKVCDGTRYHACRATFPCSASGRSGGRTDSWHL